MTRIAQINSDGSRYYIGFPKEGTRRPETYKTPVNAKRAAEAKGWTVEGDLPNPNAKSGAHLCKMYGDVVIISFDGMDCRGTLEGANKLLVRLGFKPVRITRNMLNPQGGQFLIDADTPSYCDPGSEAYHSM
jgi:hypothetical protein